MAINFISTLTLMTQVAEAQSPGMAREQVHNNIYWKIYFDNLTINLTMFFLALGDFYPYAAQASVSS